MLEASANDLKIEVVDEQCVAIVWNFYADFLKSVWPLHSRTNAILSLSNHENNVLDLSIKKKCCYLCFGARDFFCNHLAEHLFKGN